ncbi:MAG: hypothetical protein CFH06_00218 [Alphaproteobacteria bacterium MarineAlpha3_Bin5]|nr:MAG: hypothetical protein CFH06_00218 [Alphaproteobacteria bacterium MarineAlpha3_Bin5]
MDAQITIAFCYGWLTEAYFPDLVGSLLDPKKRVSVIYLISAVVVALLWGFYTQKRVSTKSFFSILTMLFSKDIWLSPSARADYGLFVINKAIILAAAPVLISRLAITTALFFYFHQYFSSGASILNNIPQWLSTVIYTIFLFILDDASRYFLHRLLHQVPFLWAFHKIHHSADKLTPFTVLRTHPVEGLAFFFRSTLVQAITISLFVFLFGEKIDLLEIYGVNLILFLFNFSGANLRHSHVPIAYGNCAEKFLISPAQHQIHHSAALQHQNKNFGAILAIWDYLGGSLHLSTRNMKLNFGLTDSVFSNNHKLIFLYFSPFLEIYKHCFFYLFSDTKTYNRRSTIAILKTKDQL